MFKQIKQIKQILGKQGFSEPLLCYGTLWISKK